MSLPLSDSHWSRLCPQAAGDFDPRLETLRVMATALARGAPWIGQDPVTGLLRFLADALPQGVDMRPPGAAGHSFDERWLLALLDAQAQGDSAAYRFLLRSRMGQADASEAHFRATQARIWLEAWL